MSSQELRTAEVEMAELPLQASLSGLGGEWQGAGRVERGVSNSRIPDSVRAFEITPGHPDRDHASLI